MKRVVVFGAKGMLGYGVCSYLLKNGCEVQALGRKEFDIARDPHTDLTRFIARGDVVINCAGIIKPMIASTKIEDVIRINSVFPRNLAKICRSMDVPCFQITTDCAYSGKKGNYTELDLFDADDIYGMSKNGGEMSECMVLRTSIVGEEVGQARSLLSWAISQKGKKVNGFTNHIWNGITTVEYAKALLTIVKQGLYQPGVFHLHSPNGVNKFELLSIISEVYNLDLEVNATQTEVTCDRSLASVFPLSSKVVTSDIKTQFIEMQQHFGS